MNRQIQQLEPFARSQSMHHFKFNKYARKNI